MDLATEHPSCAECNATAEARRHRGETGLPATSSLELGAEAKALCATLRDAAFLPPPTPPTSEEAAKALFALGQSLRLLAQQDEPVTVTWEDLSRAPLSWADCLQLIPIQTIAQSVPRCGTGRAPEPTSAVPRRVLELLRTQLDILAAQSTLSQVAAAHKSELEAQTTAWASSVLDQAKRIAERKRAPEAAAETLKSAAKVALPADDTAQETL